MHVPHSLSSTSAFDCSCAFMHDVPFQIIFAPSRAPMCIPAEPDIRSFPAWLLRLPQLSLCPPTPRGIWVSQEITLGDLCASGACVDQAGPVQPHQ